MTDQLTPEQLAEWLNRAPQPVREFDTGPNGETIRYRPWAEWFKEGYYLGNRGGPAHEIEPLTAQQAFAELLELTETLLRMAEEAKPGAYANGNTDPNGLIDEGEVLAHDLMKRVEAAITEAKRFLA